MLRFVATLVFLGISSTTPAGEPITIDRFDPPLSAQWEVKSFKGLTDYQIIADGDDLVLRGTAKGAASALIRKIDIDLAATPILSWRWRIDHTLTKGDARSKEGDDYAARIYVIFPHWFAPKTTSINYIWANRLPQGEVIPNPFFGNARMLAVESGDSRAGEWIVERRNIVEDYRRIFGKEPPPLGAVALMVDSDNTGESASGWFDDIQFLQASP